MTEAEIARARQDFRRALAAATGKTSLKGALPQRVRLRLRLTHHVDGAAIWLVLHERYRLAVSLWRVFRLWR